MWDECRGVSKVVAGGLNGRASLSDTFRFVAHREDLFLRESRVRNSGNSSNVW